MGDLSELRQKLGLNNNNSNKSTSPFKTNTSNKINSFNDDKRRQQEEERRRKEEEERKANERRNAKLRAIEDLAHKESQIKQPIASIEPREQESNTSYQTNRLRGYKSQILNPHTEFSNTLDDDFYQANENVKAIGKKLTIEDVTPEYDNDIDNKLNKIKESIKPGPESLMYSIKEGYNERALMDMLSKESYRKMLGKPNNVDKIEKFMDENPDLFASRDYSDGTSNKFWRNTARGATDVAMQQVQSVKSALPEIATYTGVGAALGTAFATPTLGVAAPITSTTGAVLGFKYGMKTGAAKHMYQVEAGLSYNDMIKEGIPHEIAKPIAMGVGAVNGLIETVQLGRTVEHIPGLDEVIQKVKKEGLQASMDSIKKLGLTYAGDLAKNIGEELAQENVGMLGKEIAQVYNSEQDPNVYGGFKNYVEKVKTPEWRDIMLDVAVGTAESMWLLPGLSGAGGVVVNSGIRSLDVAQQKAYNKKKDTLLNVQLPDLIKNAEVDILNSDEAISKYNALRISLDEASSQEEVSNKDKEQISKLKEELDTTLSKLEYRAKEMDSEIEYLPANNKEIEDMFLSDDFNVDEVELYTKGINETTVEYYKDANKYGILESIKEKIINGEENVTIADSILKSLPKKERSILNATAMVNEVEKMMSEIKSQSIMNRFYNISMAKDVLANNISPTEEKATQATNTDIPEGTVEGDNVVNNTLELPSDENSTESLVEPLNENTENTKVNVNTNTESVLKDAKNKERAATYLWKFIETEDKDNWYNYLSYLSDGADIREAQKIYDIVTGENIGKEEFESLSKLQDELYNVESDANEDLKGLVEPENDTKSANIEETSSKFQTSDIIKVPVNKMILDPIRFQFRYEQGSDGTTTRLEGTEWNTDIADADNVLLWQDKYNDLYMVNGHYRRGLALANGVAELNAKIISYKDMDAETARAVGAMINIAQGHATSIDVAKVIKDIGITLAEMQKQGIPPKSKIAKDGYALSQLDNWIFTAVATKQIPIERAIIIGRELGDNKEGQKQIIKAIDKLEVKGKNITNGVLTEMIAAVKGTAQESFTEQTLFGEETFTKNLFVERSEIVDYVKTQLRDRKNILSKVSKAKNASMLESLGNKIKVDDNVKQMDEAEQALWIIDKTLNYQGTKINEFFNDLAKEYANATPQDKVKIKKRALAELIKLMEGGNLLNETINTKGKRDSLKDSIRRSETDGEEGAESRTGDTEQEILEGQVDIFGNAVNQLKATDQVKVVYNKGTELWTKRDMKPILEAMKKNIFFNGLEVVFTGKEGKKFWTREELDNAGYTSSKEGIYTAYGSYRTLIPQSSQGSVGDNARWEHQGDSSTDRNRDIGDSFKASGRIEINNGAKKDTILHEIIHFLQDRMDVIKPKTAALIRAWEKDIREEAIAKNIPVLDGKELLVHALLHGEFGYAKDNPIGDLVAVDNDIVEDIKAILGQDIVDLAFGTDKAIPSDERALKAKYEGYARRMFLGKDDALYEDTKAAIENRKVEIRKELANNRAATYHNPSSSLYVIVSPSTKGSNYQVTTMSPKLGPLSDAQYDSIDEVADRLIEDNMYYMANEIHYQLKKVNRSVADELYGIAISRGYRTDNNGNGNRISFGLTDNQIVNAYHDSRVGNFSAQDFDELIKDNKDVPVRVKNDIIRGIFEATKKGFDVDNKDVTFLQYLHRFYGMPIGKGLYKEDVITYKNGKIIIAEREYAQADREEILAGNNPYKDFEIGNSNTLEKALDDYKMWMNRDVKQTLSKDFIYLDYKELEKIEKDYENFRDNIETYRNKGIETEFTGEPHYDISYQLKEAAATDTQEFKNWFKDSKVVDSEGNPLVVYHGTNAIFEEFEESKIGSNYGFEEFRGFFFTNDRDTAEYVADDNAGMLEDATPTVMEVYLNLGNPLVVKAKNRNKYDNGIDPSNYFDANGEELIYQAREYGHDGVIVEGETSGKSHSIYVVFNPTQIKSIYNNGMFNEYDPNINYQLKESNIVNVDGFYSNLENVINDKMGKRAKASDLMNMLTKNGVKPEELEWFEISEFLDGKDFVYKEEVLDHMRTKSIEFYPKDMGGEFSSYTLDGGDNYRFNAYVYNNNSGTPFIYQPHFGSMQNVIGHTRYKDRVGANGEKVLLIEELQSDWHQKGRTEGYSNATKIKKFENALYNYAREMQIKYGVAWWDQATLDEQNKYSDLEQDVLIEEGRKIPDAPLKESITDFLIKAAIKDAVEGGYDYIAWTTGKQQADRYQLTNVIDRLEWMQFPIDVKEGKGILKAYNNNGELAFSETVKPEQIPDYVGKELANKLLSQESDSEWTKDNGNLQVLEGVDLETGGEFHKKLYDNYVPRMIKKYGKKWGLNVGNTNITMDGLRDISQIEFRTAEQLIKDAQYVKPNASKEFIRKYDYFMELHEQRNERILDIDYLEMYERARTNLEDVLLDEENKYFVAQPSIPVTPQMIEDVMTQGQPLFQLKEVPSTNGNLVAMHNITEAKLRNILKLGGIPGPSIAITTVDRTIDSFGDISLIFNKDSIDPRRKTNNVFAADVYSPRYPKVKIEIDRNAQIWDKFKDEMGSNEIFNLQEWLTMDRPPLDHDVMRKMYLMDKGLPDTLKTWKMDEQTLNDYATWTDDILAQANYQRLIGVPEQESYYASGVRNYTTNKYIPETLDNVLKVMKKQSIRGGEGGKYVGRVRALAAKQFKSIKDIKTHEYLLENEIEEIKEQVNEQQYQAEKILMKYSGYERGFDEIYDTFNNYYNITDSRSIEGMQQALNRLDEKMYGKVTESDLHELVGYAEWLRDLPTEYFEAKLRRIMPLSEIQAVLVPYELNDTRLIEQLKEKGINLIERYSEGQRQQAMDSILRQNDVSFQLKEADTNTEQFKKWFRDSKVVDDEGNPIRVLHGTDDAGFETFSSYSSNYYFTSSPEVASTYADGEVNEIQQDSNLVAGIYPAYLRIDNPYIIEGYGSNWDNVNGKSINDWVDEIKSTNAYDGIIFKDVIDTHPNFDEDTVSDVYVAFNPKQIKSVYNYETWDVNNANIYYQLKEEPDLEERSWGQTVRDAAITSPELKQILTDNKFMYEVKHNEDTMLNAAKLIDEKGLNWVEARLLSDLDIKDPTLGAASQILIFKFMQDGETDRAFKMVDAIAPKLTTMGQAIQIFSVFGRQTPEGMLRYAHKTLKGTMTEQEIINTNKDTKILVDEFNKVNREVLEEIDLVGELQDIQSKTPEELLARRIASTLATPKSREKDALQMMVDTLFKVAKESPLPDNKAIPTDPLLFVADAIANREEYRNVWEIAKEIVANKFKDDPDKLAMLEDYFNMGINKTFADSQLSKAMDNELKDMSIKIRDIVREHFSTTDKVTESLVDKLVTRSGLTKAEALILEHHIRKQMDMKTRTAKESILKNTFKERKKYERKTLDQKIIELSNLGALQNINYKHLVAEKLGLATMTPELGDYIYNQANYIQTLQPGRQRDVEVGKMIKEIMDHVPTSKWSKVATFRIISMLLTGKTTIRNLLGNNMFKDLEFFTLNTVGATLDKAISMKTGNRTALFRLFDAHKVYGKGYMQGLKLGIEDSLMGIDTSESSTKFDLKQNRTFKYTHSNRGGIIGAVENVVKNILPASETALDIALRATDRAASLGIVMDSLAEQMEIAGVTEATEGMMAIAVALGKYRTFQDETALSNMFASIKRGANYIGVGGKKIEGTNKRTPNEFGFGDLFMPFPKTSANILGRAIDYSPVGAAMTVFKLLSDTSGSSYLKQRMAVEGFSRAIMGTTMIGIGAILAKMGILTGSNPDDDEDIYKLQKAHGLRDFSVNVSAIYRHLLGRNNAGELKKGDTIASYDWAEPIAMALAIGADIQLGGTDAKDLLSVVVRAWETSVTALTSQPLLTGLSNLFRYGDLAEGISQLFLDMPASFTPTLFSHVAQFIDGRDTDPYTFYEGGRAVASKVINKAPGLRGNIPSRYTVLGKEKRYYPEDQNLVTRALNIFLNPAITSKYMPTDEAQFLFDLYEESGNPDIVPRPPQKTYKIDGVTYTFTPESWEEMSKWLGERYKDEIGYAMNTYMKSWSAEEQADEIEWIIKEVKNEAKEKVVKLGKKVD